MESVFRATCRTQVTKLCNTIADYIKTFDNGNYSNVSDPNGVESQISIYLQRIRNAHSNLRKADEAMKSLIKSEDLAKECESVIEYDDKAVTVIAQLENILRIHFKQNLEVTVSGEEERNITTVQEENISSGVKLKPFQLKKFDGNFENWLPFWELFKRAVHENKQLSVAAKFNFLSESLIGKAEATIAGFTPTEKCYKEAIELLLDEYGHTEKLVEKFVQKLMNLKPVYSYSDTRSLRYLYNEVVSTMRTLSPFQISSSQYDIMVKSILLKRIPSTMRLEFHRRLKRGNESTVLNSSIDSAVERLRGNSGQEGEQLNILLSFIKSELEAMEMAQLSESEKKLSERKETKSKTCTAATLHVTNNNFEQYCVFCKRNNHSTAACRSKTDIEYKKSILRKEGRCFRCTNKNHNSKFCKTANIKCKECSGRHVTSMCEREYNEKRKKISEENVKQAAISTAGHNESHSAPATTLNVVEKTEREIFLQTAKVIISNVNNSSQVVSRIIMDNGSQKTYITEKIKNVLKLKTHGVEILNIVAFGSDKCEAKEYEIVKIALQSQYQKNVVNINAIVVKSICDDNLPQPIMIKDLSTHIKVELADNTIISENAVTGVNMLIGQDYYWKFNTTETKKISDDPIAVKTFFGWTIQGLYFKFNKQYVLNVTENNNNDFFDVSIFWNLESIGIKNNSDNNDLYEKTISKIKFVNGRYVVKLPWKIIGEYLHDNKLVAKKPLYNLTSKLMKNYERLLEYDREIRGLLNSGIAEKVTNFNNKELVYYMPHKPVYREDTTTSKMRIVFDASSSEMGFTSLNDHLSSGDNMVADLLPILLKFRSNKIAMVADIEKAFLQIAITNEDRDSHRFLWYATTPQPNRQIPEIAEYRMTRVTFGATSSPFLLSATIQHHLEKCKKKYGAICGKLQQSFYIDDLIMSVNSQEEAKQVFETASNVMMLANFKLRKWNTNDATVAGIFDECQKVIEQKVLGLNWWTINDVIGALLRYPYRIYILQNIWKENTEWDQLLNGESLSNFQSWQDELNILSEFQVERCLSHSNESKKDLHIFADASPKAFGAVAYIRQTTRCGKITTNIICSKNRVSPMKQEDKEITLPKLELTAALIASRLKQFITNSLDFKINTVTMWTDSLITLNWINGQGKQCKPYVKARVTEINKLTNIYDWRHCDGNANPADLLTRGIKAHQLIDSYVWRYGPKWLTESEYNWPEQKFVDRSINLIVSVPEASTENFTNVMDIERFSKLTRLIRATAYVFKFIRQLKNSIKSGAKVKTINKTEYLTASELQEAEEYLIKNEQNRYYHEELECLKKNQKIPVNSKLVSLNPTYCDGLLRANCRLPEGEFCTDIRNPIILPKKSYLSHLIVLAAHKKTYHGGISTVLAFIRTKYWIIKGRQLIKQILSRCVVCLRFHGKSAREPWNVLPIERVTTERPFYTTGVDFAGPLYVTEEKMQIDRKVYIMLFTCAAIRAVHLELVGDMSTKSCLNALRRFVARRGTPAVIMSDNAKTFKRVDLELRKLEELLKSEEVQNMAANQNITWKFIPERAAWWGGFWERLVRSVKICLKSAIGKLKLSLDDLTTFLTEVESVINSRPITYVTSDHNDLEALTPSHFLSNCKCILFPVDITSDGSTIAKSWCLRQTLIKKYLKRWRSEYLCQLRSIHHNKSELSKSVRVGDVVLIHEENKPRLLWRLAVVQQIYQGRDGRVRACDVRLQNLQVLKRPIQLLYPLEITAAGAEDVKNVCKY